MKILVIDGQGGGLGKQLVAALSAQCPQAQLTAVGTNSLAASAMRKAGAVRTATGENAVVVNCRHADVIVGPIGIVIADDIASGGMGDGCRDAFAVDKAIIAIGVLGTHMCGQQALELNEQVVCIHHAVLG